MLQAGCSDITEQRPGSNLWQADLGLPVELDQIQIM
jgi:hypothetical protein